MLKNLKELEIDVIKCPDKNKNEATKELQYKANDKLFKFMSTPLTPTEAKTLVDELIKIGVELSKVESQFLSPIQCIQASLKEIIKKVRVYVKEFEWSVEDGERIQKSMNYVVVQYLKAKRNGTLNPKKITHLLDDWKHIYNYLVSPNLERFKTLNTKAFISARKELLEEYVKFYAV